ncbi:hypothetical protein [Alterisphingorhabdus coralli]|uniref:Haem-binding uptake Tiki superfamily ChaN domain-containing protein n=1 Tax=Alterisphingorhabdus coralli TaxID=3071408 RepID=A0AA97FBL4_9SPHN|nr:hypothetical protein [Parasphingorhabdus sp. SCSIO 66989]WOE76060.1 hypothetical protein RB602_04900 [Parasphingorhabdus sp. SCSIO 66989]
MTPKVNISVPYRTMMRLFAALIISLTISACQAEPNGHTSSQASPGVPADKRDGKTEVIVMGMLHSGHLSSRTYPLSRIETAIRTIKPDTVLTEIPPDRIDAALASYRETGMVTEKRTRAFPEYTEVIIPLQAEMGFTVKGTAGWTPEIASNRRSMLAAIESDPERYNQWRQWEKAQQSFRESVKQRGSGPEYIHSPEYDAAIAARFAPYVRYFDTDLGTGGWEAINKAHWHNIASELNAVSGEEQRVLITYGAFHKYQILRRLGERDDVIVTDALLFFDDS